jgi:hypothetical protein
MKKMSTLFSIAIFILGISHVFLFAQDFKSVKIDNIQLKESTKLIDKDAYIGKLSTNLNMLYKMTSEKKDITAFVKQAQLQLVGENVVVEIYPQTGETTKSINSAVLKKMGVTIKAVAKFSLLAEVPVVQLEKIIKEVPGIRKIGQPMKPKAFSITSEGVALMNADDWHTAGHTGEDVKVAIIDGGFIYLDDAQANGDIPPTYVSHDFSGQGLQTGTEHGTAVAEAVYDVAPDAELYLYKIDNFTNLQQAEEACETNDVDVINHSMGWYLAGGYYDGTGEVCDVANDAIDDGIVWVNAAGNEADGYHYRGIFDNAGGGYHDFSGDGYNINVFGPEPGYAYIVGAGYSLSVFLNWDDYPGSAQDYDLHVVRKQYNPPGNWTIVASSTEPQTGTQRPEEEVHTTTFGADAFYGVVVEKVSATVNVDFTLFNWFAPFVYFQAANSLVDPGTVDEVVTVGAIAATNYAAGPQEDFSSQGPTNDGRIKPDVAAPDSCQCYAYGGEFPGTSQASPHVAGICALIKSAFPTHTNDDIKSYLYQDCTVDLGTPGKDNIYGYGKVELKTPLYILHLGVESGVDVFPQETATYDYYTASASALMTLEFIDDTYSQDQDYIYTTYHSGTAGEDMDATDLRLAMNAEEPGPYHFSHFAEADEDMSLKKIVHWIDYQVPGTDEPNTPALVPVEGDYNWVAVRGFVTDIDPCDQGSLWTIPDVTLYWLWLNDPRAAGLGFNAYISASEFKDSYYDLVDGSYRSVLEPPEGIAVNSKDDIYRNVKLTLSKQQANDELASDISAKSSLGGYDWAGLLPASLKDFSEFNTIFNACAFNKLMEVTDLDAQDEYCLVYFTNTSLKTRVAGSAVLMIDREDASLLGVSWTKRSQAYLPLSEEKAIAAAGETAASAMKEYKYYDLENPDGIALVWSQNFNSSRFLPAYEIVFNSSSEEYADIAVIVQQDGSCQLTEEALKKYRGDGASLELPEDFELTQNYPNPFNPTTTIRYALPEDANVKLTVYNMMGREIKSLVNQKLSAGYHYAEWDGTDNNGNIVANGLYLYRIEAGTYVMTHKMMFLK